MPRSLHELLAHEQVDRFRADGPSTADGIPLSELRALRRVADRRTFAERQLSEAVAAARRANLSWRLIGEVVGTTGEAARQRYSRRQSA